MLKLKWSRAQREKQRSAGIRQWQGVRAKGRKGFVLPATAAGLLARAGGWVLRGWVRAESRWGVAAALRGGGDVLLLGVGLDKGSQEDAVEQGCLEDGDCY